MYNNLEKGDILITAQGGIYMVSEYKIGRYVATTLDTDYIGTICYYDEIHGSMVDLALAIGTEEGGIVRVISKHSFKNLFDNII